VQIDDLLAKLDNTQAEIDRVRDEKDAEIAVLQEGMDQTLQQLSDAQQVWGPRFVCYRVRSQSC
jgi:huntingtin-interacting protein 1-related protein